jgi:hypothetical protein
LGEDQRTSRRWGSLLANSRRNGLSFDDLAGQIDADIAAVYEGSFEQLEAAQPGGAAPSAYRLEQLQSYANERAEAAREMAHGLRPSCTQVTSQWRKCAATHRPGGTERLALWPCSLQRVNMVSIADVIPLSNGKRAPVLLVDWKLVGITQPEPQMPVPEIPPPLPPEMPQPLEPLGAPPPTENPVPMREPPMTLPPQS